MRINKHIKVHIALIGLLLLIGQIGVLQHSVKHLFHTQDQSCQIFIQCAKTGDGIITYVPLFPATVQHLLFFTLIIISYTLIPLRRYSARAPPLTLS